MALNYQFFHHQTRQPTNTSQNPK